MSSLFALILGLVQGFTEFLPISSSGHLVLAAALLDYRSPGLMLETVVHLATTGAVIIYFRERLKSLFRGMISDPATRSLVFKLGLAFLTTAVIGLALSPWINALFESPAVTGGMLLLTAGALISVRRIRPVADPKALFDISWKVALLVGLAQGVAIFPGISRSGLTIVAGLWGGQSRTAAAEFSFLLAIPTLLAASAFSLWREPRLSGADAGDMLIAAAFAFVSGLFAIHWLMRWLRGGRLWWFSIYCAVIGAGALLVWGLDLL